MRKHIHFITLQKMVLCKIQNKCNGAYIPRKTHKYSSSVPLQVILMFNHIAHVNPCVSKNKDQIVFPSNLSRSC